MFKITTQTDPTRTIFHLEGQLAGPWVRELEDCWLNAASSNRPVRVMLCAVTFMDDKGIALLAEMYQHGAELVAEGCMNKAIVEEITRGERP
jgi:anti-anti-sigma regulatory factor